MEKLILLALSFMLLLPCKVAAQQYYVYEKEANVTLQKGKDKVSLVPGMKLSATDKVNVPAKGSLTLVSLETNKQYSITKPATGFIRSLVADGRSSVKELTASYIGFISKKLFNKKIVSMGRPNVHDAPGALYRDVNDSTSADTRLITCFYVYQTYADVARISDGGDTLSIKPKAILINQDSIYIPEGRYINIIELDTQRFYHFTKTGTNALGNLLTDTTTTSKALDEKSFALICRQLFTDIDIKQPLAKVEEEQQP